MTQDAFDAFDAFDKFVEYIDELQRKGSITHDENYELYNMVLDMVNMMESEKHKDTINVRNKIKQFIMENI